MTPILIIISALILLNFLFLMFSCNASSKNTNTRKKKNIEGKIVVLKSKLNSISDKKIPWAKKSS